MFRWTVLFAALIGLGYGVHLVVPPAPRSVIEASFLMLTPDGALLIEGNRVNEADPTIRGPINVWDTRTQKIQASYLHGKEIAGALTRNGRFLVGEQTDGRFHFIDLVARHEWSAQLSKASLRASSPFALDASADGRFVSILNTDDRGPPSYPSYLTLVEVDEAKPVLETAVLLGSLFPFTPDGKFVIYGQNDGLVVWNLAMRKVEKRLPRARGWFEISADSEFLIGFLAKAETDRLHAVAAWRLPSLNLHGTIELDPRLHYHPPGLVAAPDSRHLALFQSNSVVRQLDLWSLDPWRQLATLQNAEGSSIWAAFAPDSKSLAVVNGKELVILETATGKARWRYPLPSSEIAGKGNLTIIFSKDSSLVLPRNSGIPEIVFLDTQTGAERGRFKSFRASMCVAFRGADKASRTAFVHNVTVPTPPLSSVRQFFAKWFPPLGWQEGYQVIDVPSGRVVFEARVPKSRDGAAELFGNDTFVIRREQSETTRYEFWDVPSPPRWSWILGVELAAVMTLWLASVILRRRRKPVVRDSQREAPPASLPNGR